VDKLKRGGKKDEVREVREKKERRKEKERRRRRIHVKKEEGS
jgi:hypothetical protein